MIKPLTKAHKFIVAIFSVLGAIVLALGFILPSVFLHALALFLVVATLFVIILLIDLRTNVLLLKVTHRKQLGEELDNTFAQFEALLRVRDFLVDKPDLPPARHWAASPDFLVHLYSQITDHRPKTIVELGSGLTTLIGAYALKNAGYGGVIHSVEHSREYLEQTQVTIRRHGLEAFVKFHEAPLKQLTIEGKNFSWYSTQFMDELDAVDLLIVDGPPLKVCQHARYPALPVFRSKFTVAASILIDDADRVDELEIVRMWLEEYPEWLKTELPSEKGCVLIQKR